MTIKLAAGLGNPGERYAQTRHNAGEWFADALAQSAGQTFTRKRALGGELATVGGARLLKPESFMNESGRCVAAAAKFYGVAAEEILIAHDEADLPPGAARLKFGGGEAGHNGLRDVSAALASRDYWRLRLGVGKNENTGDTADYVLRAPSAAERELIFSALRRALAVWEEIANGNMQRAMLILHTPPATTTEAEAEAEAQMKAKAKVKTD